MKFNPTFLEILVFLVVSLSFLFGPKFAAGYKSIFGGDVVHDPSNPNRLKIAHYVPETFAFCHTAAGRKLCPGQNERAQGAAPISLIPGVMPVSIP